MGAHTGPSPDATARRAPTRPHGLLIVPCIRGPGQHGPHARPSVSPWASATRVNRSLSSGKMRVNTCSDRTRSCTLRSWLQGRPHGRLLPSEGVTDGTRRRAYVTAAGRYTDLLSRNFCSKRLGTYPLRHPYLTAATTRRWLRGSSTESLWPGRPTSGGRSPNAVSKRDALHSSGADCVDTVSVPIENCTEVPTEIAHSGRLLSAGP